MFTQTKQLWFEKLPLSLWNVLILFIIVETEMKVDFTNQESQHTNQLSAKNQLETYKLDEQGSLIICPVVYVAEDNIDTKISVLGFIEEQNGSETPFTIELEDYIDI